MHPFLWKDGSLRDLGTLGGRQAGAAALNDAGWVVGFSTTAGEQETRAFLHDGSSLRDLGTLGGGYSSAVAVNNRGQVAGDSYTLNRDLHGFLYENGMMTDLGTLGGWYSTVYDLNDLGQLVGETADLSGNSRAFLWENGAMIDLNSLLPLDSGWELFSAYAISDGGHILGFGMVQGTYDWFLLSLNRVVTNQPPVANAGPDLQVECAGPFTAVVLNGNASRDPDVVTATAGDNCDPAPVCKIIGIRSNEPITGKTDKTTPDWEITGALSANLRAESALVERVHTLVVRCVDASGNSVTANLAVPVSAGNAKKDSALHFAVR